MNAIEAIERTIEFCRTITLEYVQDLTDAELLVRSVPGTNHIAWQLGHLITSEHGMVSALGHTMPALPAGFAEQYSKETAASDDPANFVTKQEYLDLMAKMRTATLAALRATPEGDMEEPAPEAVRSYAPTIAALFTLIGTHELMHAGQYVPIRRKLGKPAKF